MINEIQERALKHIKRCDAIFDGRDHRSDKEFAYQQMRILTLELLDEYINLARDFVRKT